MLKLRVGDYVTSWDLKQYVYCPVIPWVRANYLVEEPMTLSMELGRLSIEEKELVARELELPQPVRYELYVVCRKLRAIGVVDIVAGNRRLTVVEVKKFYRNNVRHFQLQLKFYAYLVSSELAPVHKAILKVGSKVLNYVVEVDDLRRVEELVKKVREVMESPKPPIVNPNPRQCLMCWYRRYCPRC